MTAFEEGCPLLARFADRRSAEEAMAMIEAHGFPALRVDLIPPPTRTSWFTRRRILWGAGGAVTGAVIGGLLAGVFALLMNVERGMIVGGPAGVALTGAFIGAIVLGMLGLLTGLGLGESAAPKEVAEREVRLDEIPGEALLRVIVTRDADDRPIRDLLTRAGALSVGAEAHSELPDERVIASRRVQERPA